MGLTKRHKKRLLKQTARLSTVGIMASFFQTVWLFTRIRNLYKLINKKQ